ncbi:hypothetical protein M0R45_001960 [Rubus argutus]|uniref:Uncharacterized protein n=1 Tax=Rubus argutus TaxID=59490 RepID=A0AAW1VEQ5_RUBAR
MLSLTVIVYVQSNVSWSLGFGIPAMLMLLSCALFFMGAKLFVKVKASGSPMTSVAQVIVVAFKKGQLKQPEQPWLSLFVYMPPNSINSKLPYTHQFRCLDKAAILTPEDQINPDGSAANPWRLCSMQQVEEMKCLVRLLPIWAAALVYYVVIVQQHTYATFQALQSDRRLGNFEIPAASYYVFLMLAMTIWIPIYDRLVVPFLQRRTGIEGGITVLQRIGTGIFLSIISMLVSAIVEERRRSIALTKPIPGIRTRGDISSMSGFWLVPQLTLAGLAEAFTAIGQVEFYYKQFPENMRSIAGITEGGATGNWLPDDLNKGRLDYFYYMIAALGVVNFGYFLICASWYQYKGSGIDNTLEVEVMPKEPEKFA